MTAAIDNTAPITISLVGDTFTGADGSDYVADGKVVVSNLPAGLVAVLMKTDSTHLSATLSGNAILHNTPNQSTNLTFMFKNAAFTSNNEVAVADSGRSDLQVLFRNPVLSYSGYFFYESSDNDGTIDNTGSVTISLAGDTFTGTNGSDVVSAGKVAVGNLPTGLTALIQLAGPTQASVRITGNAAASDPSNNVSALSFIFLNSAFSNGPASVVTNYAITNLSILYTCFTNFDLTIVTNTSGFGYGTVSLDPTGNVYLAGSNVLLTATPATNSVFAGWSGDLVSTNNPMSLTMNTNKSVTANFVFDGYIISASAGAGGTILPSGPTLVFAGATQVFSIASAEWYVIAGVTVDGVSTGVVSSVTFDNVATNHTIGASFSPLLASRETPLWWLAQYGWTNNFDAVELADQDGDGVATWLEYLAGTDPTNPISRSVVQHGAVRGIL